MAASSINLQYRNQYENNYSSFEKFHTCFMHNTVIYIIQKYRMHIDFLEAIYHKKNRRRLSKKIADDFKSFRVY